MYNPEKLATQGTQDKDKTKQTHNTKELGQQKNNDLQNTKEKSKDQTTRITLM